MLIPNVRVLHRQEVAKLLISSQGVDIKLEVNLVLARGVIDTPNKMPLCDKAQNDYDAFSCYSSCSHRAALRR